MPKATELNATECERFEVLTAVLRTIQIFWDVTLGRSVIFEVSKGRNIVIFRVQAV
jgi:hypothetical protein